MRKINTKTIGSLALIGCLSSSTIIQAAVVEKPQITVNQQQVSGNKSEVSIAVNGLGDTVIAFELSIMGDNFKEISALSTNIREAYTTYVKTEENGKDRLTYYIVSNDKNKALNLSSDTNISFSILDNLNIEECNLKVIELGYVTKTYNNTEIVNNSNQLENKPSTPEIEKPPVQDEVEKPSTPEVEKPPVQDEVEKPSTPENDSPNNGNGSSGGSSSNKPSYEVKPDEPTIEDEKVENNPDTEDNNIPTEDNGIVETPIAFNDVNSHWAKDSISRMTRKGLVRGYADGTFKPNGIITRSEFAAILSRAFNLSSDVTVDKFKDVVPGKWYVEPISALYNNGLISGRADGTFGVNDPITNEEIATMLYRAITVLKLDVASTNETTTVFTDSSSISNYAKESVEALAKIGLIKGRPDGSFAPKDSTTRAQATVLIDRLLESIK